MAIRQTGCAIYQPDGPGQDLAGVYSGSSGPPRATASIRTSVSLFGELSIRRTDERYDKLLKKLAMADSFVIGQ